MPRSVSKRLRLHGHDYTSSGAYFVTICTYRRQLLFADSDLRACIEKVWTALPQRFPSVQLDVWVVMPNHFHAVLWLNDPPQATPERPSLSTVVGGFKSLVAVQWLLWLREVHPERSEKIWQRGYYEQIIRDERHLNAVRLYIRNNPHRWDEDFKQVE